MCSRNTTKYAPPGSTITIDGHAAGPVVTLAVTDQGRAFPRPSARRCSTSSTVSPRAIATTGTGLGLAIVRGFIEAHGGAVRALAGPDGRGTRIELDLPVAAPMSAP